MKILESHRQIAEHIGNNSAAGHYMAGLCDKAIQFGRDEDCITILELYHTWWLAFGFEKKGVSSILRRYCYGVLAAANQWEPSHNGNGKHIADYIPF